MGGVLNTLMAVGGAPGVVAGIGNGSQAGAGGLRVDTNGTWLNGTSAGNWVNPANASITPFYQVKVDVTAGAFTSGDATGSFLDCSATRQWNKNTPGTVTITVTFREKATGIVRSTQAGITCTVT